MRDSIKALPKDERVKEPAGRRGNITVRRLKNLREIREGLGLSQADLCEEIGVTRPRLSDLENRKSAPSASTLQALSTYLGMDPEDLLDPPSRTMEDRLDAMEARLREITELLREGRA